MSENERSLVLQGVPSEIAKGCVNMSYNEFVKYFVKVYIEKSKENPELRECRQEVILHNQHIEETLKRIDQLRAASRVLISQQAFLSKSCNRPPQIQTRTVAVYAKISEDNEEEIAKYKSSKDPKVKQDIQKSVSEEGTQTMLTNDDIDKLEQMLPKSTSEISIQTEPDAFTSDENEAGMEHRARNPLKRNLSNEDDFPQKMNTDDPLREIVYNRSSGIITDKIIRKIIHSNESYGKIIHEGEPPHKIIRINSPPHRISQEDERLHKIIEPEVPLHDGILKSNPSRKMRILRKIVRNGKIIRIFEHCENGRKGKSLSKSVGTDSPPQIPVPDSDSLQVAISSSPADAEISGCDSPPIIIPCGSSTPPLPIVITSDDPLCGDPPEVIVPTSNGTHEPTNQSSDISHPALVNSSPQGTLRGSGLQVAVRSSGPPQAVVRSGGNRQVAIRSRGPPQVAARNDSPPPSTAVHGNESDTKTDVDGSHPSETMDGPQNENNDDSVASTMNSAKDPFPKTANDTDVSLTTTSSNGELLEVQIKVEDSELLPESINGGDSTKKKSSKSKQSSAATNSSKTRESNKRSVEVVDLVSDDEDSALPSTKGKAPATPKTIIIPIGTAPTTSTSTSSIPSVSMLPTLPSTVQVRAASAISASPSSLCMVRPIAAQFVNRTMSPRLISRPIGPAGSARLTYLVPITSTSLFNQMNSSQTLFRGPAPSGNVVTLTPIHPVTQPPGPRGSSSK